MASPEHVEVAKQGTLAIKEWRAKHPGEGLDLSGADLSQAWLGRADLHKTNLRRANLRLAHLSEADLRQADLRDADLGAAELIGADLTKADLSWANLNSAFKRGTNLVGVRLWETVLADLTLSTAKGLDSIEHFGPSIIDERTLRASWPLPEVFLRGIGLSNHLIEYLPSLMGQAIEFYSCFISHSSRDQAFVQRLHADLQIKGVRCWYAPESLKIGDRFRVRIDEAIRLHDKLLLVLSGDSVNCAWVESEVEAAFEKERNATESDERRTVLFPVRVDDAVMESDKAWAGEIRRTRHIGDFRRWKEHNAYQHSFERLLRDLKAAKTTRP